MLINARSKGGSAVLELALSAVVVLSVGFGVYGYQQTQNVQPSKSAAVIR